MSILCPFCKRLGTHHTDFWERYCSFCARYHEDLLAILARDLKKDLDDFEKMLLPGIFESPEVRSLAIADLARQALPAALLRARRAEAQVAPLEEEISREQTRTKSFIYEVKKLQTNNRRLKANLVKSNERLADVREQLQRAEKRLKQLGEPHGSRPVRKQEGHALGAEKVWSDPQQNWLNRENARIRPRRGARKGTAGRKGS